MYIDEKMKKSKKGVCTKNKKYTRTKHIYNDNNKNKNTNKNKRVRDIYLPKQTDCNRFLNASTVVALVTEHGSKFQETTVDGKNEFK